jgi:hypothetical protein
MALEPRSLGVPETLLGLRPRLRKDRLERASPVTTINLGNHHAIVPIVERKARHGDKTHSEVSFDGDAEPLLQLGRDPMPPMTGVPAPVVDKATGRDIGSCRRASCRECGFIAFHRCSSPRPNEERSIRRAWQRPNMPKPAGARRIGSCWIEPLGPLLGVRSAATHPLVLLIIAHSGLWSSEKRGASAPRWPRACDGGVATGPASGKGHPRVLQNSSRIL